MKKAICFIIFFLLVSITFAQQKSTKESSGLFPKDGPEIGSNLPDFELKDSTGQIWILSKLKGKMVVIYFWASWSTLCREELPDFQSYYDQMQRDKTDQAQILTVLYKDDPQKAMAYIKKNGFTFPVLFDTDNKVSSAYGLTGVPVTFLVDDIKGALIAKIPGPGRWWGPQPQPEGHSMLDKEMAKKHNDKDKQIIAKTQIELLGQALDQFRLDTGRYPTSKEGLKALMKNPGIKGWDGPYLKGEIPMDPWGRTYIYISPGKHGDYDLFSLGEDGKPGGTGKSKDITSW